jgi:hypothetical protein
MFLKKKSRISTLSTSNSGYGSKELKGILDDVFVTLTFIIKVLIIVKS